MRSERIWELDAIRGLCILCVIVIHVVFDCQYFLNWNVDLPAFYLFIQNNGGILFILLSGICATLGSRSFRRGLIVFACGLLITVVTYGMAALGYADRDVIIHFGILHLLGVSMMLYPLLKKLPTWAVGVIGAVIVFVGYVFLSMRVPSEWLFVLGLRSPTYTAGDYYPLLPFFGWFCLGVVLGRTLYRKQRSLLPNAPKDAAVLRFLRFCGRHSLPIYLLHQPICYAVLSLIARIRN